MITGQDTAAVLSGWEGNRRSGVAPAVHHRLSGVSTYKLRGLRKGNEHPPTLSCRPSFY